MSKSVYIATVEPNSGKSIAVLGLMRMLLGRTPRVGYFRPIIGNVKEDGVDNHIKTVVDHFGLNLDYKDAYAFTRQELIAKQNREGDGGILDSIISKYKQLESRFDFTLVEGTDFSDDRNIMEFDGNVSIAKNLGIPVMILVSAKGKSSGELVESALAACKAFKDKDVEVLTVFANMVPQEEMQSTARLLRDQLPDSVEVAVLPEVKMLSYPTIKEILDALGGKLLFGKDHLNNQVANPGVGAMQLRNYLTALKDDALVVTPGDRADLIIGVLQANISTNYPKIAGIVLTGGLIPEESIMKLIEGVPETVPIISVEEGTFEVTNRVGSLNPQIYSDNEQKINASISTFERFVDVDALSNKFITFQSTGMTPRMFQYNLVKKAQESKKHIVLPEGSDERILEAAYRLTSSGIVRVTLLGDPKKVKTHARKLGFQLDEEKVDIVNPYESGKREEYAQVFHELRKHKNVTIEIAREVMSDFSYYGTMMVHLGDADGMVSGAVNTTQHTIRPALQFIKTKRDVSVVSSVFFMCLEDRVSIFGDCAINPNPDAVQLAEIAISSAETSAAFGIEPKIAMLSYSSGSSGKGADVDKVREATEIVRTQRPDLKVEGPIQYDAAVDPQVGKKKLPDSDVAGQASVLIFPDLNTGNNTYKAVQRETGALAIGPMLQGLNKPVNDLSRGCTVDDIFNTVIITAIQAQDF